MMKNCMWEVTLIPSIFTIVTFYIRYIIIVFTALLLLFTHKMDANLTFKSENIPFHSIYLGYFCYSG